MPLIPDTSIYRDGPRSFLREGLLGYDAAMAANDATKRRRDEDAQRKQQEQQRLRQQGFKQNLNGLLGSFGQYAYTPEGQRGLFEEMSKAGYGQEMMGLMGGMPEIQQPKPQEFQFKEFGDSAVTFNPANGQAQVIPGLTKPQKVPESKTPEMKMGKDGYYHQYDPASKQFVRTNLEGQPQQPTPWSPVVVGSPDGSSRTVFVDPRNPRAPAIDPNLPKAGGAGEGVDIPGLAPIQGAKITKKSVDEVKKAAESYTDFMKQLADYEAVYDRVGTEAVGANAEDLASRATGLKLTLKELENLGVLQGPDLGLMNEMVPNAGGVMAKGRGLLNPLLGNKFKTNLSTLRQRIEGKFNAKIFSNGFRKAGAIGGASTSAPAPKLTKNADGSFDYNPGN